MTLAEYINARRNRIIVDNIPVLDVAEEARTAVAFRNGIMVLFASASSAKFLLHLVSFSKALLPKRCTTTWRYRNIGGKRCFHQTPNISSVIESSVVVFVAAAPAPCSDAVSDSTFSSDPNTKISPGITILTILG
ncbi:hypothetical protein C0J52_17942 [Blattella germanica]|nr:hypothetical protein C0J52_17942 [Blattella germanica]